jgi:DNA-directed RNA polymerase specialized sigma24 family protein
VAVVLVHGFGYPLAEAAGVLDCSVSTLRNHLDRGLTHFRHDLDDAHA